LDENFSILLLNIQGVNTATKLALLEEYLNSMAKSPTVIALCETWLDNIDVKNLNFKNYKLAASYGRKNSNRGGVALLVNKISGLKFNAIKTDSFELAFETCSINVHIKNRVIQLVLVYRPSNRQNNGQLQNFYNHLENLLVNSIAQDKEIVLLGDLNVDLLKRTSDSSQLLDIMSAYQFSLLNELKPTRSFNESATLIDHLFCNFQCMNNVDILPLCFSDHDAVFCKFDIKFKLPEDKWIYNRLYSDENWQNFLEKLMAENWTEMYLKSSIHEISKAFMDKLIGLFDSAFPIKKTLIKGNKFNKVNLSEHTKMSQMELRELGERMSITQDPALKSTLRKQFNSLKKYVGFCIDNDARSANDRMIKQSSNKGKVAWAIVNSIEGKCKQGSNIDCLRIDGVNINDDQKIVNHLNAQFLESTPSLDNVNIDYEDWNIDNAEEFHLAPCSDTEIVDIINSFKAKDSTSWDGISTRVLKRISLLVAAPLSYLANESFSQGEFPDNLKLSLLFPSFKKGDHCDPNNYRPIAMSSPVSKVLEKVFLNRLELYFESNNLLTDKQHGFRKKKSTITALFDCVSEIYDSVENREKVNLILYDFKNAFGCLVPDILISKLKKYGLDDKSLSWLKSFLTERKQYVQLKVFDEKNVQRVIKSDTATSSMGVPQGTTLGPFSWNSYSNDFALYVIIACLILFADDSSVIVKGKTAKDVNDKTVQTNNAVVNFAENNFLRLNAAKTNILQVHTHQTRNIVKPDIQIYDQTVDTCNEAKLLGVYLTDTMNWSRQCDHVVNKLRSVCFLFTKLRRRISASLLRQVYFSYVQSHILYSIVIWGGSPHLERVSVAQKRVIRAMAGVRFRWSPDQTDSCKPLFLQFNILPVFCIYIVECVKFVKNNPLKFTLANETEGSRSYSTRNKVVHDCDLYVKSATLQMTAQDPNVMIARVFNHLPLALKLSVSDKNFVNYVKKLVGEHLFYDKFEFFGHNFE
jgi:exonuclease III